MGLNNGKITIPFTFNKDSGDVQRCLGYYNGSLEALVDNADINMWAKYKPVIYANDFTSSQMNADGSWKSTSNWWRSRDGNCGITINIDTYRVGTNGQGTVTDDNLLPNTLNRLAANINGGNHGWGYDRPYGGAYAPYRLNDFNGYNHYAPKPIRNVNVADEVEITPSRQWTQYVDMLTPPGGAIADRDYLIPTDIVSLSLVPGFAIYRKVNGVYDVLGWVTGHVWNGYSVYGSDELVIASQAGYCEGHFKDRGTYYVLPLFFSHEMAQPGNGKSLNNVGVYIVPAPGVTFYPFVCYSTAKPIIAEAKLSTRQIQPMWRFSTTIRFDAQDTETYGGGTFDEVQAAIVNESWDGTSYPSASDVPWRQSDTNVEVPYGTVIDWTSTGTLMLLQDNWRFIVRMKQYGSWTDWRIWDLLQPVTPNDLQESDN